jgi:hypothetical protein
MDQSQIETRLAMLPLAMAVKTMGLEDPSHLGFEVNRVGILRIGFGGNRKGDC